MEASPVVAARNPFRFDGPPAFPLRRSAAACPLFRFDGPPRPARFSASTVSRGLPAFPLRRPAAACPLFRFDGPLRPVAFRKTSKFVDIGRIPAISLQFL